MRRHLAIAFALASCAPGAGLAPLPASPQGAYRLGSGDKVRVITFDNAQLSGQFTVDDQGNVAIPLIGALPAASLTPSELAASLAAAFRRHDLLKQPSVSVEVASYRPIFVLGEVARPGQYAFSPGMTMLTAVAIAGGFTYRAQDAYASDVRTTGGTAAEGRITPLSFLAPGDVVKVYERRF